METKEVYKTWLEAKKSEKTREKYEKSVNLFCEMLFQKKAYEISERDLQNLSYSGEKGVYGNFIKPLRAKGNKDSTIKSHYTAVMSYFTALSRDEVFDNVNLDKIKKTALNSVDLDAKDGGHYESIAKEEVEQLEEWLRARKYNKDEDGVLGEKYALIVDFMFKTAIRSTATFNVTWDNFTIQKSPYGGMWAKLEALDKGRKLNVKWIPYDYYNKLKAAFYTGNKTATIFGDLNQNTLSKLISTFGNEVLGRAISIHSLKVGAISTLYSQTKDMMLVKEFADHDNITTTQRYIRLNPNPSQSGSAIMMENRDYSDLDKLSKKELLALIHRRADSENAIYNNAKEMGLV